MMQNLLLSCSLPMAGIKTRKQSYSKLSELVGSGKDFLPSEVLTLRAVIQKGIVIREGVLVELEKAKTEVHSKDIIAQLVPLIVAQWQIANAKFTPPVTIQEKSIRTKVERLWWMVEEVKRGRAGKGLRKKVELLLD